MASYFASLGYQCPTSANPSEFYVDLVSVDYSSPEDETTTRHRIHSLADRFATGSQAKALRNELDKLLHQYVAACSSTDTTGGSDGTDTERSKSKVTKSSIIGSKVQVGGNSRHGPFTGIRRIVRHMGRSLEKFKILHRRAWRQVTRDKALNIARLMSSLFSSLLFGAIYFKMGNGVKTIPDRLGLLQVAAGKFPHSIYYLDFLPSLPT